MKEFNEIIHKLSKSKIWFIFGSAVTIFCLSLYVFIDSLTGRAGRSESLEVSLSLALMIVSVIGMAINIVSAYKLKGWKKTTPLLLMVVCIGTAIYGYFIATFQL